MKATEIAPGVARLATSISNVYFVGEPDGAWTLIDAGVPQHEAAILDAARQRFGSRAPQAIVLTHGHFDHAGSVRGLSDAWNCPIYAAQAEMPFLVGRSDYPPADPTVGGFIGFASRFFSTEGYDLTSTGRLKTLPQDGEMPGLPGWRRINTPGHSPGHVSFFRAADKVLIAGDACATVDLQSWLEAPLQKQRVSRPPLPFTPDWIAARKSVEAIADLKPQVLACGHGIPMSGPVVSQQLEALARGLMPPLQGRYVPNPATFDENGTVFVPPPAPDTLPAKLALFGAGVLALSAFGIVRARRK